MQEDDNYIHLIPVIKESDKPKKTHKKHKKSKAMATMYTELMSVLGNLTVELHATCSKEPKMIVTSATKDTEVVFGCKYNNIMRGFNFDFHCNTKASESKMEKG